MRKMLSRHMIVSCMWILSTAHAQAHDFWIEPDSFTPHENQAVGISLRFGVGFSGQSLPYINSMFTDFSLTDTKGSSHIRSRQGDEPAATIVATTGAQLLGYQSVPQFVELKADKFNQYLVDEGIEYIRLERKRRGESDSPAPENFVRCAKALIQTGPANQEVYRKKLGYTLELIPQSDPYQLKKDDSLEFQLLYRDKPIDGLQLQALPKSNPESVQKVRTNENGKASVKIDRHGVWLIKVVLILPVEQRQQIDNETPTALWQSYWASYVFELTDRTP